MASRDKALKVEDNRVVTLAYTLSEAGGEVLDQATEKDPVVYLHGQGSLVPALEDALKGREAGEKFELDLAPEDAFGPRLEDSLRVIPRDAFPAEVDLEPGLELALEDDGEPVPFWISKVEGDRVTIDLNHPFAGKKVHFEGEVLKIREATEDEMAHGHAHGPDGHHHH
jgi:FKBP-type peptidyl-prolyl cis-trans isomerase SlyD